MAFRRRELAMDHQTPPTRYWKGMREGRLLKRLQKWGGRGVEGAEEVLEKERVARLANSPPTPKAEEEEEEGISRTVIMFWVCLGRSGIGERCAVLVSLGLGGAGRTK
jgi:hypothetical protein